MVAAPSRLIPPSLRVDALLVADDGITIRATAEGAVVRCPLCGEPASRVHRRPVRALGDLPWAGIFVHRCVRARTFFCDTPTCPRQVFSERLTGIAADLGAQNRPAAGCAPRHRRRPRLRRQP